MTRIDVTMLGAIDLDALVPTEPWGVGSWRDDAEEVHADLVGIPVSDSLVIYPKGAEMLRAVNEMAASDDWA